MHTQLLQHLLKDIRTSVEASINLIALASPGHSYEVVDRVEHFSKGHAPPFFILFTVLMFTVLLGESLMEKKTIAKYEFAGKRDRLFI
jgi:hypothetical protein